MDDNLKRLQLPCHLIDIHYLERFLEKSAGEGYLLAGFDRLFENGKFREVMAGNYHFCVDLYKKVLKKKDLASDEFEEYKDVCGQSGWTFCCAYKNLVVFYSQEKERPMELQTDEPIALELLRRITLQTERQILLWRAGGAMLWAVLFAGIYVGSYLKKGYLDISPSSSGNVVICLSIWGVPVIGAWIQYLFMAGKIKKGIPLLRTRPYWDRETMLNLAFLLMLAFLSFAGYRAGVGLVTALGLAGAVILALVLAVRYDQYRKGRLGEGANLDTVCRLISIIPVLFVFAAIALLPREGNFRYELVSEASDTIYNQTTEDRRVITLGIGKKDLGWDGEESEFYHINQTRFSDREWLIYYMDTTSITEALKDPRRKARYVGTMIVRLNKKEMLSAYLKQKELDLTGSKEFQAADGFESFLTESGKEMVHVNGNLVVVHFLNEFDEKSFDVGDPGLLEALKEKLAMIEKEPWDEVSLDE